MALVSMEPALAQLLPLLRRHATSAAGQRLALPLPISALASQLPVPSVAPAQPRYVQAASAPLADRPALDPPDVSAAKAAQEHPLAHRLARAAALAGKLQQFFRSVGGASPQPPSFPPS